MSMMVHMFVPTPRPTIVLLFATGLWGGYIFYAYFPGSMSFDSFMTLAQARAGVYADGRPPLLAMIWRQVDSVWPGSGGMLLLQLALVYGGFALLVASVARPLSWSTTLVAGTFLFNPAVFGIISVIWVDIFMAGVFLSALGLLALAESTTAGRKTLCICGAILFVSLGIASRHNAAAAAFPIIAYGAMIARGQHLRGKLFVVPLLTSAIITLLLFLASNLLSSTTVTKKEYYWTFLLQYDLVGVAVTSGNPEVPSSILPATMEDLRTLYSPRSVIPLIVGQQVHASSESFPTATPLPAERFKNSESARKELVWDWLGVIVKQPTIYLSHRGRVFASLIGLPPYELWAPTFSRIDENDLGIRSRDGVSSPIMAFLAACVGKTGLSPAFYLLLSGLCVVVTLKLMSSSSDPLLRCSLAVTSSGLLHMTGLFFTAVSSDYRYSHWMVISTHLGVMLLLMSFANRWPHSSWKEFWSVETRR